MHEDLEIVRVLRCAWNFAILLTSVGKLSNRDVLSTSVASFLTTFRLVGAGVRGKGATTEGHIVLCELVKLHTSLGMSGARHPSIFLPYAKCRYMSRSVGYECSDQGDCQFRKKP